MMHQREITDKKVCVVVPCFNEEHRFPLLEFENAYKSYDFHFVFVNDGSTDSTCDILKHFMIGREDRVTVIDSRINKGKAEAVRSGILHANKSKTFSIIGFVDADLATPLEEIYPLIKHIDGRHLCAFGARIGNKRAAIERRFHRHVISRCFSFYTQAILRVKATDSQCGAKFFNSAVVEQLFSDPFETKWLFDIEIYFRIKDQMRMRSTESVIAEVPLNSWKDMPGSKIRFKRVLQIASEIARIQYRQLFRKTSSRILPTETE
jgi:dolichyl-phosphate beta-glucosyltransferase